MGRGLPKDPAAIRVSEVPAVMVVLNRMCIILIRGEDDVELIVSKVTPAERDCSLWDRILLCIIPYA